MTQPAPASPPDSVDLPNASLSSTAPDDETNDDDLTSTTTGLNPDPDDVKLADAITFLPAGDDDDDLSSEDTDDDRG